MWLVMEKNQKHFKKDRFAEGMLIYMVSALLLISAGLYVFYRYLGSFEASRASNVEDAFADSFTDEDMYKLLQEQGFDLEMSGFETAEEILQEIYDSLEGRPCSIRRCSSEYRDDAPVYTLRVGSTDVATLYLNNSGDAGFGLNTWEAGTLKLNRDILPEPRWETRM